jgi:hypothetical protein
MKAYVIDANERSISEVDVANIEDVKSLIRPDCDEVYIQRIFQNADMIVLDAVGFYPSLDFHEGFKHMGLLDTESPYSAWPFVGRAVVLGKLKDDDFNFDSVKMSREEAFKKFRFLIPSQGREWLDENFYIEI